MCRGTYIVSYSCGHVIYTPSVCLQEVAPHYRCEPRGMKITQPPARCVGKKKSLAIGARLFRHTTKYTPRQQHSCYCYCTPRVLLLLLILTDRFRNLECYSRELEPNQNLPTSARFKPDLDARENMEFEAQVTHLARDSEESSRSSADSQAVAEIARW